MGDTCRANEKGQGHVLPNSSGEQLFISAINTPYPSSFHFYSARTHSLARTSQNPSAAANSIIVSEEELHCLDLVAVVLTPAAEIFPPLPPSTSSSAKLGRGRSEPTNFQIYTSSSSCSSSRVIKSYFYYLYYYWWFSSNLQKVFILQLPHSKHLAQSSALDLFL